ncbi:asparagine synthase (glutamine-hydrolyzing) [Sphingomonas sp. RG327]|uniref:asparagine synthase (glutamine-hydrolyzing) n=1 Tax=Sphingomonas anseongensis TaxID=2908207 RepID=A0ABT0RCQ5_9SPHN|nr:asparagine synthase (glutamine-hydrolyzing) [Sphingomonas anseongensis]MCL6678040.1 asparagine synthase (glutamine-hydrolyzing) [Sphingomonas anseongensis]
MCGISGFVGGDWSSTAAVRDTVSRMGRSLDHRGPDRTDGWIDADNLVAFSHNRLSILDLSPAGDQPMTSASGRFVIVYNGEIYNHSTIRDELAAASLAVNWRGHSDTETLLAAIEAWGVRGAVERCTGMFAFALWDRSERTLTLVRDRLGEKPLYYGRQGGADSPFLFGSEVKALAQHPQFEADIDRRSLTLLLRYNNVPAPFSIYRGIHKLLPGTILTLRSSGAEPEIEHYWSAAEVAQSGVRNRLELGEEEAIDQLERLLETSIGQQMIADVPLGAFLSGGVDSSAVVALMQKLSSRPVRTFSIGFVEKDYNEADHAKAIAGHLGTDHTELYVAPAQARDVIPSLPKIYDEPFADSSQIPTHLVSMLAHQQVKVALSGDGGDEIFGGYNRYLYTGQLWGKIAALPKPLRSVAARAITSIPASAWTSFGNRAGGFLPRIARARVLGEKLHKGASLLSSNSVSDLYTAMVSQWRDPASVVIGGTEPATAATDGSDTLAGLSDVERMMALDLAGYLPDDILVKVDRAAMAVSLETRVPFLDHNVVEFAWRLPVDFRIRNGETKWILRQLLYRHVPRQLIERPKMGFGIPIGAWLRGPLRDWAEALLDERRLREEGYFHPEPIRRLWKAHLDGGVDEQHRLWIILMFQQWLEHAQQRTRLDVPLAAAS